MAILLTDYESMRSWMISYGKISAGQYHDIIFKLSWVGLLQNQIGVRARSCWEPGSLEWGGTPTGSHTPASDSICFGFWVPDCELPQPRSHRQGRRQRGRRQRWSSTKAPSTWLRSPSPPRPGAAPTRLSIRWDGGCYGAPARRGTRRGRSSSSRWSGRARRQTLWCKSPETRDLRCCQWLF